MLSAQYVNKCITYLNTILEEVTSPLKNVNIPQVDLAIHNKESDELLELRQQCQNLKRKLKIQYYRNSQLEAKLRSMTLDSQSGMVDDAAPPPGMAETEVAPIKTQEITAFADQDAGWVQEVKGGYDQTMDLANNSDSMLGNFLQRPVRQSAQSWLVGQPFFYKFNPWAAFCENPFVRDKITNYELLRMKLHVKVVVSGTKFHYGRALASYNPFTRGDQVTVERNFIQQDLIQASQKPHFFINPTKNTGGELCMPFFYDKNYLEIPQADWNDMGELTISSFGNLLHANGGTDPVTVTIYLWAEDVVLTMPTASSAPLVSQSGRRSKRNLSENDNKNNISNDEYGSGIISKPAAALAKAAGALGKVPVIGPYMTATQIATGSIAQIAKIFGYSRPNIITDTQLIKPSPTGNLANVDAADAALKLTLDSKAETTVDSRTVGLDGADQMGILDYVKRESYLTSFSWTQSDVPDDLLWNTRVLPMQLDNIQSEIHMTPLAHIATMFESWQGSLKFRFQIVKSDFHKGRILVRWDPNAFTSAVEYNTNYSRVVDIAETDDFEIVVGWGQAAPWKNCGLPYNTGSNFSTVSRLSHNENEGNGVLELTVLNELVSPSENTPISVNVFVSACDDFKFAAPDINRASDYHLFKPPVTRVLESQSGVPNTETGDTTNSDKPTASGEMTTIASKSEQDDPTYSVYYGDPPTTIRELCKRYTFTRYWAPTQASAGAMRINGLRNKNLPYHTGWDPEGIDTSVANGPITVGPTHTVSWFLPAYAGYRGGMRKKYLFTGNLKQCPQVARLDYKNSGNGSSFDSEVLLGTTRANQVKYLTSRFGSGGGGAATTNMEINNTIEVEFPFYWNRRFGAARTIRAQQLQCNSHRVGTLAINIDQTGPDSDPYGIIYQQYDAAAEDFSLFFFTGVPIYWQYTMNEAT